MNHHQMQEVRISTIGESIHQVLEDKGEKGPWFVNKVTALFDDEKVVHFRLQHMGGTRVWYVSEYGEVKTKLQFEAEMRSKRKGGNYKHISTVYE